MTTLLDTHSTAGFLDALASAAPTPGGGSAAAVMGAMGAALVSMVANLTIGKKGYEAVDGRGPQDLLVDSPKRCASEALRAWLLRTLRPSIRADG